MRVITVITQKRGKMIYGATIRKQVIGRIEYLLAYKNGRLVSAVGHKV